METNAIYVACLPLISPELGVVTMLHWGIVWASTKDSGMIFTANHLGSVWKPVMLPWAMDSSNMHLHRPGTYLLIRIAAPEQVSPYHLQRIHESLNDPNAFRNGTRSRVSRIVRQLQAEGRINVDLEMFEQELDEKASAKIDLYENRAAKEARPFMAISLHCW